MVECLCSIFQNFPAVRFKPLSLLTFDLKVIDVRERGRPREYFSSFLTIEHLPVSVLELGFQMVLCFLLGGILNSCS